MEYTVNKSNSNGLSRLVKEKPDVSWRMTSGHTVNLKPLMVTYLASRTYVFWKVGLSYGNILWFLTSCIGGCLQHSTDYDTAAYSMHCSCVSVRCLFSTPAFGFQHYSSHCNVDSSHIHVSRDGDVVLSWLCPRRTEGAFNFDPF